MRLCYAWRDAEGRLWAVMTHGAAVETLRRRVEYGGRKGRSAARKLARVRPPPPLPMPAPPSSWDIESITFHSDAEWP